MLQVIKKWIVLVDKGNGAVQSFYCNDNFLMNVLNKLSSFDFGSDVKRIEVKEAPVESNQQISGSLPGTMISVK